MASKLSKHIVSRIKKIYKNNIENKRYAKEISEYLEQYDVDFKYDEICNSDIVTGEITNRNGSKYLKVEGFELASANHDGTYCHQISHGEDWYSGQFYIQIDEKSFLQIFYEC